MVGTLGCMGDIRRRRRTGTKVDTWEFLLVLPRRYSFCGVSLRWVAEVSCFISMEHLLLGLTRTSDAMEIICPMSGRSAGTKDNSWVIIRRKGSLRPSGNFNPLPLAAQYLQMKKYMQ